MRLATLVGLIALAVSPAFAQSAYTITGRVVDARLDDGVPGTSVLLAGTQAGAATGLDGDFTFQADVAPGTYTLRASFVGYRTAQTEVTLGADRTVDVGTIELAEDALRSEEIVVTGSGVPTERRQIGNSISTVDAADLDVAAPTSVDQALVGKVAGALVTQNSGNPAGGISIRLRGTGTVLGSADPLYIVDGVIIDNSSAILIDLGGGAQNRLVDLNPEDIARIEIVKGAAAAALYGSRANNGVVQIFTKRGQAGAPRVTFSTSVLTNAVRKTLDVNFAQDDQGRFIGNDGSPIVLGRGGVPVLDEDGDTIPVGRFDVQDDLFRRAFGTEQYLSVAGGATGTSYFLSGGHYVNEGIIEGNLFRRLNGRVRVSQDFGDLVTLSVGGNYTNSDSDDIPNGGLTSNYGALTGFIFGPNTVDPAADPVTGTFTGGVLANPIDVVENFDFSQNTSRFTGDVQVGVKPAEGLSVDYTLGVDTYTQTALAFIPPGTTSPVDPLGSSRRAELGVTLVNQDLGLRYNRTFGGVETTTLVGGTAQYDQAENFSAVSTVVPGGVETVSGGAVPAAPGEFRSERTILGVFAQETLGFGDRLFVTAAGRYDASSAFGEDERWNFYPKVSASYDLAREPFYQSSALGRAFPTFRLRASYGETGGVTAIGAFDRFTNFGPTSYNGRPGFATPSSLGTEDIRPERQREFEVGIDLSAFGGRAGVEVTAYDQTTTDLLLRRSLAPTSGFLSVLQNVGDLQNRGVEVLLRANPVRTRSFGWDASVTFATNRNEVDGIEDADPSDGVPGLIILPESFGAVAAINGEPLGVFYTSRTFARNDQDQIVGQAVAGAGRDAEPLEDADGNPVLVPASLNDDGFLVDADGNVVYPVGGGGARVIGDPNPDFTASFINQFEIGQSVTFRVQLDGSIGQDVFNFTRRLAALSAFGTLTDFERELEGELPAGYNGRAFGLFEPYVEDGSYVKLREVALTYQVPAEVAGRVGAENLRVTAFGRNLASFDSYTGYDPETNVGGQRTVVRGFDFVEVPLPRTFGLTLSATI